MDGYHVALFIHLLALVAAATASGLAHLAHGRTARARTVAEAMEWHAFGGAVARVFPIAVLTLLATGGYMTAAGGISWSTPWVQAGIAGAVLLFAIGGFFGARMGRAGAEMARIRDEHGPNHPAPPSDPIVDTMIWVSPGIALAVVFLMTTKPALPECVVVLAAGIALGLVVGRVRARSTETAEKVALG
jgi:hypothetical protein